MDATEAAEVAEVSDAAAERASIDRLRDLKRLVDRLGKRTVDDVFALGEAFEEAAGILRGGYSAWVSHECRLEPRTVLGWRRVHTVLGARRADLVGRKVPPSVLVRIAVAPGDLRARALELIEGGRDLRLADLKALAGPAAQPPGAALRSALAAGARRLAAELEGLARDGADHVPARVAELAAAVAVLMPGTSLAETLRGLPAGTADAIADALVSLVDAPSPEPDLPAEPAAAPERRSGGFEASAFRHGLRALEICAGAGGQAYGLAQAGFVHAAVVEHWDAACDTLRAAFPGTRVIEANLRKVDLSEFAGIDLLAGGPPCVSYSKAGKRLGSRDPDDLMPRAVELVETLRPRAVLLENVPGILERGNDLHRMELLRRLSKAGYRCEWRTVRAWEFGVAQARERAILVGFREPAAMARFAWPDPVRDGTERTRTMSSALLHHFRVDGYEPTEEFLSGLDRLSPTLAGGSPNKQGADLGQENTKRVWREIGIDPNDVILTAPAADHSGPPKLNVAMVASLQGFPIDWPFQGTRVERVKQVANAFPPVVAMHLGCAVAAALTGGTFDTFKETVRKATSRMLTPGLVEARKRAPTPALPADAATAGRVPTTLMDLKPLSRLGVADGWDKAELADFLAEANRKPKPVPARRPRGKPRFA